MFGTGIALYKAKCIKDKDKKDNLWIERFPKS